VKEPTDRCYVSRRLVWQHGFHETNKIEENKSNESIMSPRLIEKTGHE